MSKIENMVKNAKVVKKEYLTDGTVKIKMEVNLRGGFAQLNSRDARPVSN